MKYNKLVIILLKGILILKHIILRVEGVVERFLQACEHLGSFCNQNRLLVGHK